MNIPAEITLRIARLGQEHGRQSRTEGWFFVPDWRKTTWDEAREILIAAAKPLIVAPLVEPGYVTIWSVSTLAPEHRARAEHHISNQIEFFTECLRICGLDDGDSIVLDAIGSPLTFSVADLMRWARDYGISIGVTLHNGREPGTGYFAVMPPGGGAPPIGVPPDACDPH